MTLASPSPHPVPPALSHTSHIPAETDPIDLSASLRQISQQESDARMRVGHCFSCGRIGHMSSTCLAKQSPGLLHHRRHRHRGRLRGPHWHFVPFPAHSHPPGSTDGKRLVPDLLPAPVHIADSLDIWTVPGTHCVKDVNAC